MADRQVVAITRSVAVPLAELTFRFTRSGGPGGQHVNKAATQVELVFDVAHSPSLTADEKRRLAAALPSYVSSEGLLRLACQSTRSQRQNREEAVERFRTLLNRALHVAKPRRPTRPTRASQQRRIDAKKRRTATKSHRRSRLDGEG